MTTNGGQDSDALMRSEIHRLGILLGHSLTRQEGPQLFELVEKIRNLSKDSPNEVAQLLARIDLDSAIKAADKEPAEQDYWTTPVNQYMKVVDAPVTLEKALDLVQDILGTGEAQEAPQCKHGHMKWREGETRGRAWGGYQCTIINHQGGEPKCDAIWYNIGSDGKWHPQKARV